VRRGLRICLAAGKYCGVCFLLPELNPFAFQVAGAAMYAPLRSQTPPRDPRTRGARSTRDVSFDEGTIERSALLIAGLQKIVALPARLVLV